MGHSQQQHGTMMKGVFLLLGSAVTIASGAGTYETELLRGIDIYNFRAEEPETGFTWDAEGSAAQDPEWREKIATAYEDCHEMSKSWPASSLNRRPLARMFGRQMIFYKCA